MAKEKKLENGDTVVSSNETKDLADVALDTTKHYADPSEGRTLFRVGKVTSVSNWIGIASPRKRVAFPPSVTDQLHRATIADMIKQGQGQVEEVDMNNFEFPDGKDDGKLTARGLSDLEWADLSERYESELALRAEIGTALRKEANEKLAANKAAAEKAAAEKAAAEKATAQEQ